MTRMSSVRVVNGVHDAMHKRHHNLDNENTARHICLMMIKIAYGSDVTALGFESKNKKWATYSALAHLRNVQLLTLAMPKYKTSPPRHEHHSDRLGQPRNKLAELRVYRTSLAAKSPFLECTEAERCPQDRSTGS